MSAACSTFVEPVMVEFYPRDVVQTLVGATLLAVPMAFTDEVWRIGAELSTGRIGWWFTLSEAAVVLCIRIMRMDTAHQRKERQWIRYSSTYSSPLPSGGWLGR